MENVRELTANLMSRPYKTDRDRKMFLPSSVWPYLHNSEIIFHRDMSVKNRCFLFYQYAQRQSQLALSKEHFKLFTNLYFVTGNLESLRQTLLGNFSAPLDGMFDLIVGLTYHVSRHAIWLTQNGLEKILPVLMERHPDLYGVVAMVSTSDARRVYNGCHESLPSSFHEHHPCWPNTPSDFVLLREDLHTQILPFKYFCLVKKT